MKKWLAVVLAVILPVLAFGAGETGEGEATISPSAILTGEALPLGLVQLTFTAKTTNMVNGVVFVKVPNAAYAPASASVVFTSGNATEISAPKFWTSGGFTYVGATVTANIDATVGLRWALATAPTSVTGTLTWTVYSATDATTTYTAEAIGTLPTTVITSSNKAASVVSQLPVALTPVLTTNTDAFTWIINLDTYYVNGNVRIDRPNDTWADFSNNTYSAGYFKKTGAGGTPTVVANYVNIPVAVATAGQDITITYGGGDPTVKVRKDEYGIAQIFPIRANAVAAAATETPIATSIRLDVWVATPTVVLTPVYSGDKTTLLMSGFAGANKKVNFGTSAMAKGSVNSSASIYNPDDYISLYGEYGCIGYISWLDTDNDGTLRTNTTNTVTYYKIPSQADIDVMIANGAVVPESSAYSAITVGNAIKVTKYAQAQYVISGLYYGDANGYMTVVADGATTTKCTSGRLAETQSVYSNPFVIPKETVYRYYLGDGNDGLQYLIENRYGLPVR